MNEDTMSEWVNRAKHSEARVESPASGVKVIRKEVPKSHGTLVMEVADKLLPWLTQWLDGKYNDEGMLLQPAHIRGFSIDMAERLVKKRFYHDNKASA